MLRRIEKYSVLSAALALLILAAWLIAETHQSQRVQEQMFKAEQAWHGQKIELSAELYQSAVDIDDSNPYAWQKLGTCYLFLGNWGRAKECSEKSVELAGPPESAFFLEQHAYTLDYIYDKAGPVSPREVLTAYESVPPTDDESPVNTRIRQLREEMSYFQTL